MRNIKAKRIVIKIGTNTLTDKAGFLDLRIIRNLVKQIAQIKNGKDIIIITSGAIGAGMRELDLKQKPSDVVMKQVCAGIGQNILMANYYSFFRKYRIKIAQILLTYNDLSDKETYKNLYNSLDRMLQLNVIPIINENDPISINEIGPSFGDNDNLSALIASKIKADLLIILTNVDGLFDRNPEDKSAVLIKEVKIINKRIESFGSGSSNLGIGGMKTKIKAAKMGTEAGVTVVIANGKKDNILLKVLNKEDVGTIFYPKK
ncbi:MAG: glutamate 5-kinase [Nanoarchaeota archaeon]